MGAWLKALGLVCTKVGVSTNTGFSFHFSLRSTMQTQFFIIVNSFQSNQASVRCVWNSLIHRGHTPSNPQNLKDQLPTSPCQNPNYTSSRSQKVRVFPAVQRFKDIQTNLNFHQSIDRKVILSVHKERERERAQGKRLYYTVFINTIFCVPINKERIEDQNDLAKPHYII